MNASVFVTLPLRRPEGTPAIKQMEECVRRIDRSEGEVIRSGQEEYESILPEDTYRTQSVDIDIGLIAAVKDTGEYLPDGTFKSETCKIYFRNSDVPALELGIPRKSMLAIMANVSKEASRTIMAQEMNRIAIAQSAGSARRG